MTAIKKVDAFINSCEHTSASLERVKADVSLILQGRFVERTTTRVADEDPAGPSKRSTRSAG
jgi:hypothetical protein